MDSENSVVESLITLLFEIFLNAFLNPSIAPLTLKINKAPLISNKTNNMLKKVIIVELGMHYKSTCFPNLGRDDYVNCCQKINFCGVVSKTVNF